MLVELNGCEHVNINMIGSHLVSRREIVVKSTARVGSHEGEAEETQHSRSRCTLAGWPLHVNISVSGSETGYGCVCFETHLGSGGRPSAITCITESNKKPIWPTHRVGVLYIK